MTPKEKAEQLFNFYFSYRFQHYTSVRNSKIIGMPKYAAKKCAFIAVENEYAAREEEVNKLSEYIGEDLHGQAIAMIRIEKQQVKTEIENI
jgi:hypothetical protein